MYAIDLRKGFKNWVKRQLGANNRPIFRVCWLNRQHDTLIHSFLHSKWTRICNLIYLGKEPSASLKTGALSNLRKTRKTPRPLRSQFLRSGRQGSQVTQETVLASSSRRSTVSLVPKSFSKSTIRHSVKPRNQVS